MRTAHHRQVASPRSRAFTLIEVLVVVAIIALLISILLPSLAAAKEQTKIVKCLANLSSIGKGCTSYLQTEKNRFAWGPGPYNVNPSTGFPTTRTWYWAGNRGQPRSGSLYLSSNPPNTYSYHDWAAAERPVNRHLYPGAKLSKTERPADGSDGPLTLLRCPSDKGIRWNNFATSTLAETVSAYRDVGTSYQSNCSWTYYAKSTVGEAAASSPHQGWGNAEIAKRLVGLMDRIIPLMEKKGPSRAVLIYEDTADWALNTADVLFNDVNYGPSYKVSSWHNKKDIHNILFMDGHAALVPVDWKQARYSISSSDKTASRAMTSGWAIRQSYREETN